MWILLIAYRPTVRWPPSIITTRSGSGREGAYRRLPFLQQRQLLWTRQTRERGNAYWKLGGAGIYDVALHRHFALFQSLLGILDLLPEYNLKMRFIRAVQLPDYFHLNACSRSAPLLQAWITTFENARRTPDRGLWKLGAEVDMSAAREWWKLEWAKFDRRSGGGHFKFEFLSPPEMWRILAMTFRIDWVRMRFRNGEVGIFRLWSPRKCMTSRSGASSWWPLPWKCWKRISKFLKITKTGKGPSVLNNHQTMKTNTQHINTSLGLLVWMRGKNSEMVKLDW